ncbi:MAG: NAD(P)H-hydrate dehydratase [Nanoarchaeota archaeon]|nr:NAD(P)H-hydrate dehydratase [Nanoarchaeota archaeon]
MKLKRKDHKGENGRVLVIGGSKDYVGAPALAAMAALKTGVDLVTVCAPEKVAWTINSYSPDIITKKFLGEELNLTHCKDIIAMSEKAECIVIGNGLGLNKDFVLKLLREIKKPFVIDADAIKVISLEVAERSIITPHAKEFEILYNNTVKKEPFGVNTEENIKNIQKYIGTNIMLLKGPIDHVFSKDKKYLNKTGNNSMTIGGTGDVLAGLCAGYVAQGADLYDAAVQAAYANGKCGEYMYRQKGYGYTASELASELWRFTR